MGKKRVASAYIYGSNYKKLVDMPISDELAESAQMAYDLSPAVADYGKLLPREVYDRILNGVFFIAYPEKTKTLREPVSTC